MYPNSPHINKEKADMYTSLDTIQQTLQSSNLFDFEYTTTRVKQELKITSAMLKLLKAKNVFTRVSKVK